MCPGLKIQHILPLSGVRVFAAIVLTYGSVGLRQVFVDEKIAAVVKGFSLICTGF